MIKIGLVYRTFKWNEIESYLSLFIRWTIYFKNKGLNGSDTKYNHCFALIGDNAYEAKLYFRKYIYTGNSYKAILLTPTFDFDEAIFSAILETQVGLRYNFWAIICQLVYQTTGVKIQNRFYRPVCSQSTAKAFYFATKFRNPVISEHFKNYDYMDPQDFVRMWKTQGLFCYYCW